MKKFEVTYLIDIVSSNPDDYTIKVQIEADDAIDAIKKVAISQTRKDSSNIEWIKNLTGDLKTIMSELVGMGYVFTKVEPVRPPFYPKINNHAHT